MQNMHANDKADCLIKARYFETTRILGPSSSESQAQEEVCTLGFGKEVATQEIWIAAV